MKIGKRVLCVLLLAPLMPSVWSHFSIATWFWQWLNLTRSLIHSHYETMNFLILKIYCHQFDESNPNTNSVDHSEIVWKRSGTTLTNSNAFVNSIMSKRALNNAYKLSKQQLQFKWENLKQLNFIATTCSHCLTVGRAKKKRTPRVWVRERERVSSQTKLNNACKCHWIILISLTGQINSDKLTGWLDRVCYKKKRSEHKHNLFRIYLKVKFETCIAHACVCLCRHSPHDIDSSTEFRIAIALMSNA